MRPAAYADRLLPGYFTEQPIEQQSIRQDEKRDKQE